MKKFLKIAGIICLGVLIWVVVIAGVVFLFSKQAKKNIAEMTKNMEVNTEDRKETTGDNPEISVNIMKDAFANQQDVSDDYYDTMQEALLNATISLELEEQYRSNIDEVIKEFEGDEYALLFYRSVKNKKEESFNFVRFKIQYDENNKQYHVKTMTGDIFRYNSIFLASDGASELVKDALWVSEIQNIGVNPEKEHFVKGTIREDFFKEGESIYNLKIEGRKPDEIIEYESFGKKWYFWYYNDLQSDRSSSELEVTLKE